MMNQRSNELIEKIMDQSLDVICIFNEQGEFVAVSKSCERIWGYNPDELIGKPYMQLVYKEDQDLTKAATTQLLTGYDLKNFKNRYVHKQGTVVEISWTARFDAEERKMFCIAREICEKTVEDHALKIREKRFRTLIQNSTDGLALLDAQGKIQEISDPGKRILNFQVHEGETKFQTNIHEEDIDKVNEAFFDIVNDPEQVQNIEYRSRMSNGNYKWIGATLQNQFNEPVVNAIVLNFTDITEWKLSEIAIAKSEKLRRHIMNSALDAIICTDIEGKVIIWNNQAEKIFGWKREEMLGKPMNSVIISEKYRKPINAGIKRYLQKGESTTMDRVIEIMALNRAHEEFPVELRIITVEQDNAPVFCAFIRDITERKRNEAEKEELLANMEKRAEELAISNAELEQFAYIASHDLQEPLRMVTSFLTQLEKKYKDQLDQKAQQYIYFATDGAVRMRRIILDLLEYSRVGRKEYEAEELDMNEVLEEVVLFHRTVIKEKGAVVTWSNLPKIYAARSPIEQVLQNLIANGLKYQLPDVKPQVVVSCRKIPRYWEFSVADNGIGIDPQFFDKIFILFQRLHYKEQYSGTGIGLAICKKIIDNFGGKIWVESEPEKGSTFYFTIRK